MGSSTTGTQEKPPKPGPLQREFDNNLKYSETIMERIKKNGVKDVFNSLNLRRK
jgi:hypothetical protein